MKNLLMILLVSGFSGLALAQTGAVGQNRGASDEAGLAAAHRSVENQLMVEEIEDAGYEIDVVEGFDEEWEEDIWIAAEADDVDANYVDPSESARFDLEDLPAADELDATWENPDQTVEDQELAIANAEEEDGGAMRGEEEVATDDADLIAESDASLEEDIALEEEADDLEEANWWEESSGNNWSALIDDMDMDEFDASLDEEEDLDLLEEIYGTN
jgi:hypothetical protein